jgi:LysM repeat protein
MKITSARIALLAGVAWLALGGAAAAEPCRQENGNLQKQLSDLGIASSRQRNDMVDRAIQHADNQKHERCDNLAAEHDYLVAMLEPGPGPQSAPRPPTPRNLWPAEARQAAQPGASPAGAGGEKHVAQASSQAPQQGSAGEAAKPITGEHARIQQTTSQPPQAEGQKPTGGAPQASPEENAPAKQQAAQPGAQKPGKAATAQACPSTVTVEKGDTLLGIARRCDKTLKAIVQANPDLQNPNLIRVGQKIRMPTG